MWLQKIVLPSDEHCLSCDMDTHTHTHVLVGEVVSVRISHTKSPVSQPSHTGPIVRGSAEELTSWPVLGGKRTGPGTWASGTELATSRDDKTASKWWDKLFPIVTFHIFRPLVYFVCPETDGTSYSEVKMDVLCVFTECQRCEACCGCT